MSASEREPEVRNTLHALDATGAWVTQSLANPAVRPAERATACSLRRYTADARLYAVGPDPSSEELVRRRQKVTAIAFSMLLTWRRSGRR